MFQLRTSSPQLGAKFTGILVEDSLSTNGHHAAITELMQVHHAIEARLVHDRESEGRQISWG